MTTLDDKPELFGTADQQALLRRGRALAHMLGSDPRFGYYGRTVCLITRQDGSVEDLAALARVQGNSNISHVPTDEAAALAAELRNAGLIPIVYDKWDGTERVLRAAQEIASSISLPSDLTLVRLNRSTDPAVVASLAETALLSGVLPLCGEILRGIGHPAVCIGAIDASGTIVSCASSALLTHPGHPTLAGQAWWGMLATRNEWRGQRLALVLGAHAILEMEQRHGIRNFMTGVEPGNAPSEAVCSRMGLAIDGYAVVGCADPASLQSGRMTK